MADNVTVLITGANRGIGLGLTELYLARPNHTVIAAVRDPSSPSSLSLDSLPAGKNSKLILVKINSTSETDPANAIKTIQTEGVNHLDIVIANAGISEGYARIEAIKTNELRQFFEVNTIGPLILFGAAYPLLKAAADKKRTAPKFIGVTSALSIISDVESSAAWDLGAYGVSKTALNFLVKRANAENDWLNAFVIDPGFAQTDMGNSGARHFGMEQAFVSVKDSTEGMVKVIDNGTKESVSGKYMVYDGSERPF
ncbi:hypothetical protein V8F06_006265 [Rhypophila decipiens]